jgi:hypothetical protein
MFSYPRNNHPYSLNNLKYLDKKQEKTKTQNQTIVIKPGPARRVDPGPGRPGGWTGPGLIKDRLWQQPGQTRATRRVDPEPG